MKVYHLDCRLGKRVISCTKCDLKPPAANTAWQREMIWGYTETWDKNPQISSFNKMYSVGFPGGTVVKNPPANAGDTGSIPGLGRFHMLRSN